VALHITLKRNEEFPMIMETDNGDIIEIRYKHRPINDTITIDVTAPKSVKIFNPSIVSQKNIKIKSKAFSRKNEVANIETGLKNEKR
jgi:hypothetical protein